MTSSIPFLVHVVHGLYSVGHKPWSLLQVPPYGNKGIFGDIVQSISHSCYSIINLLRNNGILGNWCLYHINVQGRYQEVFNYNSLTAKDGRLKSNCFCLLTVTAHKFFFLSPRLLRWLNMIWHSHASISIDTELFISKVMDALLKITLTQSKIC